LDELPESVDGETLISVLCRTALPNIGYRIVHRLGRQVVLQADLNSEQRLTVPEVAPLRKAALKAILRIVEDQKGIPPQRILAALNQRGSRARKKSAPQDI
jgi:hypothetical protein